MDKFLEKIVGFTQKRYMKVLMDGFMSIAAVSIAGSLFNLIKSIPIGAWQTFLATSGLGTLLSIPVSITSDLMAIYVVFAMAYCLAKSFNRDGFAAGIIAFGSFMILTPLTASSTAVDPATGERLVTTCLLYTSTLHRYLIHYRIAQACLRILEGKDKIYEVAEQVGFNDYKYFFQVFTRLIGVSPTQYKKNHP